MPASHQPSVIEPFLAHLPREVRDRLDREEALAEPLAQALETARAAWPEIEVSAPDFAAYLAERYVAQGTDLGDPRATLGAMHVADLYLACGCCRGDVAALVAFERRYAGDLDAAVLRLGVPRDTADEVKQRLHQQLLVCEEGREKALTKYSGRGRLAGWLRVSVTRLALRQLKQHRREVAAGDDLLEELPVRADDPELAYLKDLYRGEFKTSLERAMASLTPRQRNLLRHQLVDHLSIDEIGALYGVHRATAARWLEAARQAVVAQIKLGMMERLKIHGEEYESIMRLIQSGVDLSISRNLGGQSDLEPEEES